MVKDVPVRQAVHVHIHDDGYLANNKLTFRYTISPSPTATVLGKTLSL